MRSGTGPRARPRPPDLTLPPAGSLVHFSFSEEDTCWHPPGRSVRWVAWGQFPPLPLRALAGVGERVPCMPPGVPKVGSPTPFPWPQILGAAAGFLQVTAPQKSTRSCPVLFRMGSFHPLCAPKPGFLALMLVANIGVQRHLGSTPRPPAWSQVPLARLCSGPPGILTPSLLGLPG